jgi:aldehyde dehydrogenase (NAD+)
MKKFMTLKTFNELKEQSFQNRFDNSKKRFEKLRKIQHWIKSNPQKIYNALYADFKKPHFETEASEILVVLTELKFFIDHLSDWMQDQSVPTPISLLGHSSRIRYENKGVILIVSPWNYPFQLALNPLIAALAAGNAVVLKPSELTPATSQLIFDLCSELFLPREVTVELGDKEKTSELLSYTFDHVFFTGSTPVGKIIAQKCAEKLIPYTLELGGKSPVIIDETADLNDAISKIHWGKYLNRGQTCVAPDYILVHESIKTSFLESFKKHTQNINETQISSIINSKNESRINSMTTSNYDFQNTAVELIEIQNLDHSLMSDEIFGPVSPVISYKTLDQAVDLCRKYPDPLAFYIFSKSALTIDTLIKKIPSGGVGINTISVHLVNHHLPFGGRGPSGQGRYHGHFGFLEFSHQRAIIQQNFLNVMMRVIFPPYTPLKKKMLQMVKWITT